METTLRQTGSLAIITALIGAVASCSRPSGEIVAGSSLIQGIILDITDGRQQVHNLIPPGMCPGHFDMKPSDVEVLARSKALIIHDYQRPMANVKALIKAAGVPDERVQVVDVEDDWMTPPGQVEAVKALARIMSALDPAGAAVYAQNAAKRMESIESFGERVQQKLQGAEVAGMKVLCSAMQEPFIRWADFDIVSTYGRSEDLSVADVETLIQQAREAGVALVIDNLQSGETHIGAALARDIEGVQVVLSNFPGGFAGTETWEKACQKNVDLLLDAAAQWRQRHG